MLKTYETKDAVPEALRASAIETKDGKWVVDEPDPENEPTKLKTALERERELRKSEETARKNAEREAAELKRAAEAKQHGISEEALKKIRADVEEGFKPVADENASLKTKTQELEARVRKLTLTDRVEKLALQYGVMPDRLEDAMTFLEKRSDLGDQDGIVWKDKAGTVTADTPEAFFGKFKTEKPWLFAGTGAEGGPSLGAPATPVAATPGQLAVTQHLRDVQTAF